VKTRLTPAYFPGGLVAVRPSNPTSCGPAQPDGRFDKTKFPAPSLVVLPVQLVVPPFPSRLNILTVTPASGVSAESATTVLPRKLVVTGFTLTEAVVSAVIAEPSTVAVAVIVSGNVPVA
jgi:hypothetical protein